MPKIIHYRDKCIGCHVCQEMQPDLWRLSRTDGKATLVHATHKKGIDQLVIPESLRAINLAIAEACPVKIIQVI